MAERLLTEYRLALVYHFEEKIIVLAGLYVRHFMDLSRLRMLLLCI
jgi:hypothetical protein